MWNFLGLIIVKKVPWNYNRGHWAAQCECERQSWRPSRDQVSLKARGRTEGLFYAGEGEKQTHTLPLFPFLIHIHEHLQMPDQREGQKHACILSATGIILIWHHLRILSVLLPGVPSVYTHMLPIEPHALYSPSYIFYLANERLKQAELLYNLKKVCILD